MNLGDITTKCFILALIIRDDGQRLLLGDGYYEFKNNLQHFQPNTYQNDVVELQGTDGQLLAGQVRRTATQTFNGYIGDATVNRQTIEQKRREFMTFFRKKHFYKVVYIFPDGTAIQRKRGYIVNAPSVPEMWQRYPEYSIGLNFEDVNYYEYAEDEYGDEIYAHIVALALGGAAEGGLIWDAIGAVSNGITWSQIQTAQGEYIDITNALDREAPLASVQVDGNATQTTYSGKNLLPMKNITRTISGVTFTPQADGSIKVNGTATAQINYPINTNSASLSQNVTIGAGTYTVSDSDNSTNAFVQVYYTESGSTKYSTGTFTTTASANLGAYVRVVNGATVSNLVLYPMLEKSATATSYEPYVGGTASPNPDYPQDIQVVTGENVVGICGKNLAWTGWAQDFVTRANTVNAKVETFDGKNCVYYTASVGYQDYDNKYLFKTNFKPLTAYTFSLDIYPSSQYSNLAVEYTDGTAEILPFNLTANTWAHISVSTSALKTVKYLRVRYGAGNDYINLDTFQVEEGSTATTYEPYQAQSYTINLGSIELAKIGTYQDRIYKDEGKWYIEKQVGKVVLDGTEDGWTWADTARYAITTANIGAREAISDHFTYVNYTGHATTASPSFDISSNLASIGFHDKDITSLNNFKTWLASNPTTVYYALATPTTTEITEQSLIDQLNALGASSLYVGVNHIGTNTPNATPTLKVEYYTDYELEGAGYEWEPSGNTTKTIVTVEGVDSAWPVWTIQGEAQNPTLTNITTGQTITWNGFVPSGQTLTINMNEMTADLAGANVFEYITGEWLELRPGNNTLVYNAGGGAEADSTLSWNGVAS